MQVRSVWDARGRLSFIQQFKIFSDFSAENFPEWKSLNYGGNGPLRRFSTRRNFSTESKFSFVLQALRWN